MLPPYADLPEGPHGGRLGWHQFGQEDSVGLLNLITPDVVLAAAGLVRKGATFALNAPIDFFTPSLNPSRGTPRRETDATHLATLIGHDDVYDNFYPQASSQWDALGHVSYSKDAFYNGASKADVVPGGRNTIDHWARRGIVGRAVVLDVTADRPSYDPGSTTSFGVEDLERARELAGVELRTGDIVLLHTGFTAWYGGLSSEGKAGVPADLHAPGLEQSEDVCEYLWDHQVAALASDTFSVEAWPADFTEKSAPFGFIHQMLLGSFGMALGELWWLADLVRDCHEDGVFEALLVSAPLHARGGVGSPANAVAIK